MSQSKLSRIEGQQIVVSDSDLFIIAQALQVRIAALFPPLPTPIEAVGFNVVLSGV